MFGKLLYSDKWDKNIDNGEHIEDPTWDEVQNAIKSLDGKIKTQVIVSSEDEEAFICIGGGNNGLYNVFITLDDNESFYNLIDATKSKQNKVKLVTGGQLGDFREYKCVDIDKVIVAVKTFFETGEVEKSLDWQYKG